MEERAEELIPKKRTKKCSETHVFIIILFIILLLFSLHGLINKRKKSGTDIEIITKRFAGSGIFCRSRHIIGMIVPDRKI